MLWTGTSTGALVLYSDTYQPLRRLTTHKVSLPLVALGLVLPNSQNRVDVLSHVRLFVPISSVDRSLAASVIAALKDTKAQAAALLKVSYLFDCRPSQALLPPLHKLTRHPAGDGA